MADIFISYSHEKSSKDFVLDKLIPGLEANGTKVWVDRDGIRPTTDWLTEIYNNILQSNNFVFVISPYSIASEWCQLEIAYAIQHGKRLVPIVLHRIDDEVNMFERLKDKDKLDSLALEALQERDLKTLAKENWDALKKKQWIFIDASGTFDEQIKELDKAIKSLSEKSSSAESNPGAGKMEKGKIILGLFLPTNEHAPEAIHPGVSALDDPAACPIAWNLRFLLSFLWYRKI